MKENEIRRQNLVVENLRLFAEDRRQILKKRGEFIEITCPACECDKFQVAFKKEGFRFVTCVKCETLFVNPRPNIEQLSNYYATSKGQNNFNEKIFPASENIRRRKIFAPRAQLVVDLCRKFAVKTDVIVDVGAGFGTFCEEVKKFSVFEHVIAVEPSPGLAETCRGKGLEVIEKTIEEIEFEYVSVFTNFELIEHLYWPKDFLIACARVLPKGGLFILTTPNIKGFDLLLLGKVSDNMNAPEHLNYFHPESLSYLLECCGFEVLEVLTPGKLDAEIVRKKALKGEFDLLGQPFLRQVLLDEWQRIGDAFQQFLADNALSSHMWIVGRKL